MTTQSAITLSSTKWSIISSIINSIITVTVGAILARLLTPAVFGVIAIAYLVIAFAGYFVKLGVGPALIQQDELTPEDINFAITFSLGIAILASLVIAVLSPVIGLLFNKPESTVIIATMSLSLWFTSFTSTEIGLLRRHMQFKFLSIVSIFQTVIYGILSIVMAKMGSGIWSLVWPLIISQFIAMMIIFFRIKQLYDLRIRFSASKHIPLINYGTRYSVIGILEYFGANLDTIIVGRFFPTNQLGLYNRAYKLAYLPNELLFTSISNVMFPVFSRLQSQMEKFKETQARFFLLIGLLSTCIAMGMIPAAKDLILVFLGPQWLSSVPVLVMVLCGIPFDLMAGTFGVTFDATGKLNEKINIQIFTLFALVLGFLLLFRFGIGGIILSLISSHVLRLILYALNNHKLFGASTKVLAGNFLRILLSGVIVFFVSRFAVHQAIQWSMSSMLALCLEGFCCLVVFTIILFFNSPILLGVHNLPQSIAALRLLLKFKGEK